MTDLLGFVLISLIVEITPGPNMAYLALLTIRHGRIAGYMATAGVALGLGLLGFAAAYGASRLGRSVACALPSTAMGRHCVFLLARLD